ncbi:hypothetical protein [Streptosporangium sp. KLBMP 9127]|nr:hypothetical protein [Streptosporangium sp. KLBMP 9127]
MQDTRRTPVRMDWRGGLATPRRNRFFHGKMMDVYHFEMETAYGIAMRRMLNRLVSGGGVVCGLDVVRGADPCTIKVTAGVAIDGWGREIVVPADSAPIALPAALIDRVCGDGDQCADPAEEEPATGERRAVRRADERRGHDDAWVTVTLCYQECESDPVTVLAGDCSTTTAACAPGAVREQYHIGFEPGRADPIEVSCRFPDILRQGEIDYGALARWVTRSCPDVPRDPCIPLANLRLDCDSEDCRIDDVDIEIRPIVFGNAILFDMLSRIVDEQSGDGRRR